MNPFVAYLKRRGLLSEGEALRVAAWSSRQSDPIGIIAVEHGLILGKQIDAVLESQQARGVRFGQAAVEMGCLSPGTVEGLLTIQRMRQWSRVAEVIILGHLMPAEQILRVLAEFVLENGRVEAAGLAAAA